MQTNIFIPKIINVGYQNRKGTHTGRLAYVIYTDNKGVLRKEASWNSWRDKNIEPNEFENIPTSGFVLNKKTGDYSDGWNHRHAYCRVYDPRDFEFEITIENLLYILENTNSIKGKGLEGEFVYGWDGKDLVLMPVDAPDYKEISEYNKIIHNNENIRTKDLIVGATYITKSQQEMIYMGRYDYYSYGYKWEENGEYKISKNRSDIPMIESTNLWGHKEISFTSYEEINNYYYGKYHWFAYKEYDRDWTSNERIYKDTFKWYFKIIKSVPSNMFIACIDDKCTQDYSDIYEEMQGSFMFSPHDYTRDIECDMSLEEFLNLGITKDLTGKIRYHRFHFISSYGDGKNTTYTAEDCMGEDFGKFIIFKSVNRWNNGEIVLKHIELKDVYEKMHPKYIQTYLANGREFRKEFII